MDKLPKKFDENLLIGYESSDDAAVYKLSEDMALIQTLDFFPTMVKDPYLFGKIAAANSLSDVYAMGGRVLTAMNIVAFPEHMDIKILGEILRGGAEKVNESGGVLVGGHSIHDGTPKYGLAVAGIVHPAKVWANNSVKDGDYLLLTKPLGVGIINNAWNVNETTEEYFLEAAEAMTTLNKYAAELLMPFNVSACTDVTGFGLLGHLHEMLGGAHSAEIYADAIPVLGDALRCASEFIISAGGQKNRNHMAEYIRFEADNFPMEEVLYDPQTSGGLLFSIPPAEYEAARKQLSTLKYVPKVIGQIIKREAAEIIVK